MSARYAPRLDEIAIYNRALTVGEVTAIYDSRLVPEPAGLGMLLGAVTFIGRRRSRRRR
jgi:hypothetical protein